MARKPPARRHAPVPAKSAVEITWKSLGNHPFSARPPRDAPPAQPRPSAAAARAPATPAPPHPAANPSQTPLHRPPPRPFTYPPSRPRAPSASSSTTSGRPVGVPRLRDPRPIGAPSPRRSPWAGQHRPYARHEAALRSSNRPLEDNGLRFRRPRQSSPGAHHPCLSRQHVSSPVLDASSVPARPRPRHCSGRCPRHRARVPTWLFARKPRLTTLNSLRLCPACPRPFFRPASTGSFLVAHSSALSPVLIN